MKKEERKADHDVLLYYYNIIVIINRRTNTDLSKEIISPQYHPFIRDYSIRNEPIGSDRYNNKYYLFRGEPGYLFICDKDYHYSYYTNIDSIQLLIEWLNEPCEHVLRENLKVLLNEFTSCLKKGKFHRRIPYCLYNYKQQLKIIEQMESEEMNSELVSEQKALIIEAKEWLKQLEQNPQIESISSQPPPITYEENEWHSLYQSQISENDNFLRYNPLRTSILFYERHVSHDIKLLLDTLPPATQLYKYMYNIPDATERCKFCSEYLLNNNLHCKKCHCTMINKDTHTCNIHFNSIYYYYYINI